MIGHWTENYWWLQSPFFQKFLSPGRPGRFLDFLKTFSKQGVEFFLVEVRSCEQVTARLSKEGWCQRVDGGQKPFRPSSLALG